MITVADMIAHMAVQLDEVPGGYLEQKLRTSVLGGWARLMSMHQWAYFFRTGSLPVYASQQTGTVDFLLSARTVTLTGATWPTNATEMHIKLGYRWYPIKTRTSSTVIELYPDGHPPDDLTAEAYTIQKTRYALPSDVGDVVQILESNQNLMMMRLTPLEAHVIQEGILSSHSYPNRYTLIGDSANPNRWSLWLPTVINTDTTLQYMYVARRPQASLIREFRGLVTVTGGVATFTEDVVNSLWEGAVLRISKNSTDHPTGEFGDIPSADIVYNRNCWETRVIGITSGTVVTLADSTIAETGVAYTASTHIDVADGPMTVLLQRLCEDEWGAKLVGNHSERMVSARSLGTALHDAMAADARYVRSKGPLAQWYGLHLRDVGYVNHNQP